MVFSSHLFFFYFLPVSLVLYYLAPHRARHLVLTALSYVFYGWANPAFTVLMLVSTLIDYAAGLAMVSRWASPDATLADQLVPDASRTRRQKLALLASVISNLSLLGFFKYANFGLDSYNALVHALGYDGAGMETTLRIVLPLGISFYTFQSMSYSIDVYRGHAPVLRGFVDFACYVSMFPQLVAGPIIRFADVADQLRERTHTLEKFARGSALIALGMAKKTLLANPCGRIADTCFDAGSLHVFDAWYGAVAYAFQIYFDFSAYSDMAVGLGLMLGFVFAKNFDSPYRSQSITEFWRRWHLSLSTWLRDYLYIPLGGNKRGPWRTYANLAIVMLLGGLWHGAAWTFVAWGAIHGLLLIAERLRGKHSLYDGLPVVGRVGVTFVLLLFTWVFFRSADLPSALHYCGMMLGTAGEPREGALLLGGMLYQPYQVLTMAAAGVLTWAAPQAWDFTRTLPAWKIAWVAAALWASLAVLATQAYNPFIYFIF